MTAKKLFFSWFLLISFGLAFGQDVDEDASPAQVNRSITTGIWIPTGELSRLGVHPEIGYQFELATPRLSIGASLSLKFLKSKEVYLGRRIHSTNQLEETSSFFGGLIGLTFGVSLKDYKRHKIRLIGGLAVDGFDVLPEKQGLKEESIVAANLNIGVEYRYNFTGTKYFGIQLKYNCVNYASSGIIDLKGQPITILFVYGGFDIKLRPLFRDRYSSLSHIGY